MHAGLRLQYEEIDDMIGVIHVGTQYVLITLVQ